MYVVGIFRGPSVYQIMLSYYRWHTFVCDHCPCPESSAHGRSEETAARSILVGCSGIWDVQLPSQRVPGKEWWLSILFAALLRHVSSSKISDCRNIKLLQPVRKPNPAALLFSRSSLSSLMTWFYKAEERPDILVAGSFRSFFRLKSMAQGCIKPKSGTKGQKPPTNHIQPAEAVQQLPNSLLSSGLLDSFIPLFTNLFQCHVGRLHNEDSERRNSDRPCSGKDILAAEGTSSWSVVRKGGECCRGGCGELRKDM